MHVPYRLHLFGSASLLDKIEQAEAAVERMWSAKPTNAEIGSQERWQAAMLEWCPDLSADDPNADRPDNAWPHGLPAVFDRAVYTCQPNVSLLDQGLLSTIAEGAALTGLHVLDPQQDLLYRPDRLVVSRDGRVRPAPPLQLPAAAQASLLRLHDEKAVFQTLRQQLQRCLAPYGFRPRDDGRWGLLRRVGEIDQCVELDGYARTDGYVLRPGYRLFAARVTAAWMPFAQDIHARELDLRGSGEGGRVDGHRVATDELCGAAGQAWGRHNHSGRVRTKEDLRRWFRGLAIHIVTDGLPRLDALGTPRALAMLLLSDGQMQRLQTKADVLSLELIGRLVLARAFDAARYAAWQAAILDNWSRFRTVVQHPPGCLDPLIAHLDSPAFDPSAVGG